MAKGKPGDYEVVAAAIGRLVIAEHRVYEALQEAVKAIGPTALKALKEI